MARIADPNRKKDILLAATTVFSQNGYAGTRIADVAKAAGIGKGTIYEYFSSKEALFFATFEQLMMDMGQQMANIAANTTGSASKRLVETADAVMRAWIPSLDLYGLVLEFWSATTASPDRRRFKTAFQTGYSEARKIVSTLIQEGIRENNFRSEIDPEALASAIIGSWDALLLQAWLDPDFDPLDASQKHMQVFIDGLREIK